MFELPRIATVEAMADKRLRLRWQDGTETVVEMAGVIADFAPFAPLAEPATFAARPMSEDAAGLPKTF